MSQGPLCPNLTQKVQREVSQMANQNFSCAMLLGGLSVNLNHLKMVELVEDNILRSTEIGFHSDALATPELGYGAIIESENRWLKGTWPPGFIRNCKPSIEFLELYALCSGLFAWEQLPQFNNSRILLHCDNVTVVHMINNLTSSCKNCMFLLRLVVLHGLQSNCRISAKYINTKLNGVSDALSRDQMPRFRDLAPSMSKFPDNLPPSITPVMKIWINK